MSALRPNRPPAEAQQADPTAKNEPPGAQVYPALNALLDQAERRLEVAGDDDLWVKHFMIWMSLHRLKMRLSETL